MAKKRILLFASTLLLSLLGSSLIFAQSGGDYELTWTTVDGGGGALSGGAYSLVSSIGQPEPGYTQSGGGYSLNGGVVDAGSDGESVSLVNVYIPIVKK